MLAAIAEWPAAMAEWAASPHIAASIVLCCATLPLGDGWSLVRVWCKEFVGSAIMIALTFTPGKWWGAPGTILSPELHPILAGIDGVVPVAWLLHWLGVCVADYSCGGPNVNPGVSYSLFALGYVT